MNRIRIGRPRARSERPWPGALSPDPRDPDIARAKGARADRAFRKGRRDMIAWAGWRLWLAARTVIRAVRMANDGQVHVGMRPAHHRGGAAKRSRSAALGPVAGR